MDAVASAAQLRASLASASGWRLRVLRPVAWATQTLRGRESKFSTYPPSMRLDVVLTALELQTTRQWWADDGVTVQCPFMS